LDENEYPLPSRRGLEFLKKSLKRTYSMNKEKDFNNQQPPNYDIEFERCIDFLTRMFAKYSKDIILPEVKSKNGLDS